MQFLFAKNFVFTEVAKLRIFPHKQEIVLFKSLRKKGFVPKNCDDVPISSREEIERVSIARAKSKISDLALCNDFEWFYTQTINNDYDRYNLNEFKSILLKKFKAYKRINHDFAYLIIFEKHKNGAFHCHGLLKGIGNDIIAGDNDFLNIKFFNDIGLNSIQKIRSLERVSTYITKYMTKEFIKTDSNVSYFHSKGLKIPEEQEIIIDDFSNLELFFQNDYIKKYRIVGDKYV